MAQTDYPEDPRAAGEAEYRSLSGLAVLGLLLGLVSPVFYFGTPLVIVPVAALAASAVAYSKITANPEVLTGATIAKLGIMLAVLSIAMVVTNQFVTKQMLSAQAAPVADEWVRCAREGSIEDAYRLTQPPSLRRGPDPNGVPEAVEQWREKVSEYGEADPFPALENLQPTAARLAEVGPVRWLKGGVVELWRRYELLDDAGDTAASATIVLRRTTSRDNDPGRWIVRSAGLQPPGR